MLYGTALLRAFSAILVVSVLTACGGSGGGGGDGTPPPADNTGVDTGGSDTGSGDTGGEDTGGSDTGSGNTGGEDTAGGDSGGGDTGGEDTGGEDTGGGDTGGGDEELPVDEGVTGVWHVEIRPETVALIEYLNNRQTGIVDQWLPGRMILVVDHGDTLDISTCIDNPNLPATAVVWDADRRAYIPATEWTFGNLPISAAIERTDNQLTLAVSVGTYHLGFEATKLTTLNNSFLLSGDMLDVVHATSLTCGAVTSDGIGSTLQVTAYVDNDFLNLSFPAATAAGSYEFGVGEVTLLSAPLSALLDTTVQSATVALLVPQANRLQVGFDLVTGDASALHGEVLLNEMPLP